MLVDVTDVMPLDDYCLALRFEDGVAGVFDMKPYLSEGVFKRLSDPEAFASARVELGTVSWGNVDIAPETLYEGIVKN